MTQTTDPRRDEWRDPWASPPAPATGTGTETTPTGGPAAGDAQRVGAPQAPAAGAGDTKPFGTEHTQPLGTQHTQPLPPQTAFGHAGGPGDPGAGGPAGRSPRGPGWRGVVAVGAGAAVLSSLLTAGIVTALDEPDARTATSSSASPAGPQVAPPVARGSSSTPDWKAVAAAVEPSVVSVRVGGARGGGEGSGVILDRQGNVLTNNHVVASAADGGRISVVLSDGRTYTARIAGRDPATDLAVIRLEGAPSDLTPATLGNSDAVSVGDPVMAVGNPLGLSDTATTGIVSALDRPVTTSASEQQGPFGGQAQAEQVVTNAIQTDAAVNPGNSGGALVDGGGRVIGITSSIASLGSAMGGSSGSIGLGFAIPINEAKRVAEQLKAGRTVEHAYLGVTLADGTATVDGAQRQAAVLGQVEDGTPAAKAGMRARDAVVAVDGEALEGADSLVARIRATSPGTQVTLTVVRDGTTLEIPVTLGTRPANNS
jgi:putative serine protease PepD